jgi:hypothetical protein
MSESDYKSELLKHHTEQDVEQWISENPPPRFFKGGKYAWAFLEMPVQNFLTELREKYKRMNLA